MAFLQDKNKGLPYKFALDASGEKTYSKWVGTDEDGNDLYEEVTVPKAKFSLVGGEVKANDNLLFIFKFIGFFRVYKSDFPPDLLWLLQKPVSTVLAFKTLILGNLIKTLTKYHPWIKLDGVNLDYDRINAPKDFILGIDYRYKLDPEEQFRLIKYIGNGNNN